MVNPEGEVVGFIDIGTNSIHLLISRFDPEYGVTPIFQDKESVRMGRSLYSTGRFDQDTISKASITVTRFARTSREMGAEKIIAMATCAAREAFNSSQFIRAASRDVDIRVISGKEEARLISLGVFGPDGPSEKSLNIDIGGGSTEMTLMDGRDTLFSDSLEIGAVRFAYSLGIDCSSVVTNSQYARMRREVRSSSYHAVDLIRSMGYDRVVGSAGTLVALAEMCGARRKDGDTSYILRSELGPLMKEVRSKDSKERTTIPGLGRGRTDIIVPGGAIAEELMDLLGIERMDVSTNGLKQGMQIDYMISRGHTVFDTRDSAVLALASRCNYDRFHAESVRRNALSIFDQMRSLALHNMNDDDRNILASAATLHDIGMMVNYPNHHLISQKIIEYSDLQGFTVDEVRDIALIVGFHHKKFPGPKDPRLSGLSPHDSLRVRMCSMMLKMADVLDRHRDSTVTDVSMVMDGMCLRMRITSSDDPSMGIWRIEKLRGDFRKLFGVEISPEVH
ncbi:MAG: Ppx/GppA family phosphatase [Candidatus Methanomethylophilaceae archaeon]|nr:Ppx/GppA family phosphatase [Candidatus Methanomethylophilaceae archaeon]